MPKPLTITIDVEEVAFGKVFRTLDTMPGVISINLKGSGPTKVNESKIKESKKIKTIDLIRDWIATHSTFYAKDLNGYLFENGITNRNIVYAFITKLHNLKEIKRIEPGKYKALAIQKTLQQHQDISGKELTWNFIKNRTNFTVNELTKVFHEQKRSPGSVYSILSALVKQKKIKRIEVGEYRVLKKAVKEKQTTTNNGQTQQQQQQPVAANVGE
jgi:hypothetical protein